MPAKRPEDPPKGSPAWMSTFSDLMNLLLCFFVLLFSMSSVDSEKFQQLIASLQSTTSILPMGGATIGDGEMIGGGVRQLEFMDVHYNDMANSKAKKDSEDKDGKDETENEESVEEAYKAKELSESEEIAEQVEKALSQSGIQNLVEVNFNAEYVQLSLSGAILFESGQSDLLSDSKPVLTKISKILMKYDKNIIEVEGHTDNVPIRSERYEDNEVLSMYRARTVANFIRGKTKKKIKAAYIKSSGRGENVPVASNKTAKGRAKNRRVEIKIYNSYNSDLGE